MKIIPTLSAAAALLFPALIAAQPHLETIYKFAGSPDGSVPQGLAEGPHGVLYGTTAYGGSAGYGTVFQLTPPSTPGGQWTESILHEFTDARGEGTNPFAAPVVGRDGAIYGTTGGISSIFQLQPPAAPGGAWTENVLYLPYGEEQPAVDRGLIIGPKGELFGVVSAGCGGVLGLTPHLVSGEWSVFMDYAFPGGNSGCGPAGIAISADGVIYGVTTYGGTFGQGTIFALTPSAVPYQYTETVLYNFTGAADGGFPTQAPILVPVQIPGAAFAIYGTTTAGGSGGLGGVFELVPNFYEGTWTESSPFNFGWYGGAKIPSSPLLLYNGDFYGVTATGTQSSNAGGSIFQLSPDYNYLTETVLHNFERAAGPSGNLVMSRSGILYGTTVAGPGPDGFGTVYRIKP